MHYSTDLNSRKYPGISRAKLEIEYDNGGINRYRSEADALNDLDRALANGPEIAMDLPVIDIWLRGLSDEQMIIATAGEETEMLALMAVAPPGTDALLNHIFDNEAE